MSTRPTVAAVTVVKNEAEMLPLWEHHYGERLGLDHLVVIDDASTDGSPERSSAHVHRLEGLPGGIEFERERMSAVNHVARELLDRFDWVVFTDADEFLVPDPARYASLPDALSDPVTGVVAPMALNVVHAMAHEAPLDLSRPILEQRSWAVFSEMMCKPSMKRRRQPWMLASHGIRAPYTVDPGIFMLHLKFADADRLARSARARHEAHLTDGRGGGSWKNPTVADEFTVRMRDLDPRAAEEFDADALDPGSLIQQTPSGHTWRTAKTGNPQLRGIVRDPVVAVPRRLRGML